MTVAPTKWTGWAEQGSGEAGHDPEAPSGTPGTSKPAFSAGHRLEDNPGMRRHLVKKPSRTQGGRGSPGSTAPILRRKKKKKKLDRRPHEVQDPRGWACSFSLPLLPRASLSLPPRLALLPCSRDSWSYLVGPQTLTLGTHPRCSWS